MDFLWWINNITCQFQKLGGRPIRLRRATKYISCKDSCGLLDIGFIVNRFTWPNKRKNKPIFQRLDRALVNIYGYKNALLDPRGEEPKQGISRKERYSADHYPINLTCFKNQIQTRVKDFRMEPLWYLHNEFYFILLRLCGVNPKVVSIIIWSEAWP